MTTYCKNCEIWYDPHLDREKHTHFTTKKKRELDKAQIAFRKRIKCKCKCHIDYDNVFSFREFMHCDKCYKVKRDRWFNV